MKIDHLPCYTYDQPTHHSNQNTSLPNEYGLWKRFKNGDLEAYAVIYKKYFFVLYQYGKKVCDDHELVEDCIQDIFIKIWNNRKNLGETTSIKYYLLTALKRKLLDVLRAPHARLKSEEALSEAISYDVAVEDPISEKKDAVLKALTHLSTHQQKLLHLKFYKNLSNQEIAEELGITIQSVYNAVFKTLKSLRKQLSIIILAILIIF